MELNEDIVMVMIITSQLIDTGKTHGQIKSLFDGKFQQFIKLTDEMDKDPLMAEKVDLMLIKMFSDSLSRIEFEENNIVIKEDKNEDQ